jgi:hypothetical protein
MNVRSLLLQWFSEGDLQRVLAGLDLLCQHHADPRRREDVLLLSNRLRHQQAQQRKGTISQADYNLEHARLSEALMDLVQQLPTDWPAEPLAQVPPSAAPIPQAAPGARGFFPKWALGLGLLLAVAGLAGWLAKDRIFPQKAETSMQKPAETPVKPDPSAENSLPKPAQPGPEAKNGAQQPAPGSSPKPKQPSATTPTEPSAAPAAGKFRSFAPSRIADDMERGKVDGKFAFLNHRTRAILCCYDDAEDFSSGKAYVKQRGKYFYINKSGHCVEDCD